MDFAMTEEQSAIFDMARDFGAEKIAPFAHQWEKDGTMPREIFAELAALGFGAIYVSEESGGIGLGRLEALNLVHNHVESLEPLAGLGALRVLKVSHNRVESLGPLRGLGVLEELWVHHNRVADAGELAALGGAAYWGTARLVPVVAAATLKRGMWGKDINKRGTPAGQAQVSAAAPPSASPD